jgi:hypothetical protein
VIERAACIGRYHFKPLHEQVCLINKYVNNSDRIIFYYIIFKLVEEQGSLLPTLHLQQNASLCPRLYYDNNAINITSINNIDDSVFLHRLVRLPTYKVKTIASSEIAIVKGSKKFSLNKGH